MKDSLPLHNLTLGDIDNIHDPAEQTTARYLYDLFHHLQYLIVHEPPMIYTPLGKTRPDFFIRSTWAHTWIETAKGGIIKPRKLHQAAIMEIAGEPCIQIPNADNNPHLGRILSIAGLFLSGDIPFSVAVAEIFKGDDSIYAFRDDHKV